MMVQVTVLEVALTQLCWHPCPMPTGVSNDLHVDDDHDHEDDHDDDMEQ